MHRSHLFPALFLLLSIAFPARGQHDAEDYVGVRDPAVRAKLEQWQDYKFGLFMHWGTYSQWGIVESWSLCNEDVGWTKRSKGRYWDYDLYRQDYENLQTTFHPSDFDPARWADAAERAGMRYVIFTTKHHDGFCMFDTETTDYKITGKKTPFHKDARANITKEIFDAFRKKDFLIGAYYSKPDWHTEHYWWPYFATPDRHVNYEPARYPERWQAFKDYTYRQIEELMTGYGKVDILWLDGAWVRPADNIPEEYASWARKNDWNQDIDIPRIAAMARRHQPGLLVVDRWVAGPYENYLTPEQKVPEEALLVPWESCITMGRSWSYVPDDRYKSVRELVHLLVDVVAKGGNLLLNIGPSPEGDWAADAYQRLEGIGRWMAVNGEAIYGTEPIAPYKETKVAFTRKKDTDTVYAVYLAGEGETAPPARIWVSSLQPAPNASVRLLGHDQPLQWEAVGTGFMASIPETVRRAPPCDNAWVLKISEMDLAD